jgi:membrane-associated phospholipid phosphatase
VAVLLVLSTVYIRAHYLIDVLAAFLTTPLIYFYSGFIYKHLTQKHNPDHS